MTHFMKNLSLPVFLLFCTTLVFISCSKGGNSYTNTDHTVGMTDLKTWSGIAYGYYKGDTVLQGDTAHIVWANTFYRVITDTSFSVQKINGYQVNALETLLNYISSDSITTKTVLFDDTVSGIVSKLTLYYLADTMKLELHVWSGYNSAANQYYQNNVILHSN